PSRPTTAHAPNASGPKRAPLGAASTGAEKRAALGETSDSVAATRSRLAKVERLVACLRALGADERETAVAWLAGALPGGRLGLGPATVHDLRGVPAATAAPPPIGATRAPPETP